MPEPPEKLSVVLGGAEPGLGDLTAAVDRIGAQAGWGLRDVVAVQVVLDEVVSNIRKYSGLGETAEIGVDIIPAKTLVTIVVRDRGRPFDPLQDSASLQPRTGSGVMIGGRGIGLMRQLMDEIRYTRDGDANRLTLIRTLRADGQTTEE